jgi:hypothetical protein
MLAGQRVGDRLRVLPTGTESMGTIDNLTGGH